MNDNINLPPLPEYGAVFEPEGSFNARQMREYARQAVLADREARGAEPVAWVVKMPGGYHSLGYDSGVLNKVPHGTHLYTAAQPGELADHSVKDPYELIMKWADIYAAETGNLYSEAARDPSKAARMADERAMLAAVVAEILLQPQPVEQRPLTEEQIKEVLLTVAADVFGMMHGPEIPVAQFRASMTRVIRAIETAHGIGKEDKA